GRFGSSKLAGSLVEKTGDAGSTKRILIFLGLNILVSVLLVEAMSSVLKNLDCEVSGKNMVIFAVNGLDSCFTTLAEIIHHREPFPTFETVRNMLLLKESSFNDDFTSTTFESSSSSLTILMASSSSNIKGTLAQPVQHTQPHPTFTAHQSAVYMAHQQVLPGQAMSQSNSNGILGAAPVLYASQPTSLPSAFSTMSLQDPTWNIDTSATSHLNSDARNLSTIFNKRLFPSIHVGDGNSIPVTNTGHSIIPSHHPPLYLHNVLVTPNIIKKLIFVRVTPNIVKDFLTRHILLRCDSSDDLYPGQISMLPLCLPVPPLGTNVSVTPRMKCFVILLLVVLFLVISRSLHMFAMLVSLARLVANDSNQQHGVDFDETFSLVVKSATIRTVLSLAVSRQWPIHQLDIKNAFLNGDLSETVYMHQPPSFVDSRYPNHIVDSLHKEFDMTDLEALNYFLGISDVRHPTWLFLSQKKYALHLLERAHILAGGIHYLTFTRLDLSYAVQQICLYMHDLRELHFVALKRIMRYVQGTLELGLHLYASATTSLVGYTDADWASCPSTRRSTSNYCMFLGDNLLSWSAKRQHTIPRSSAEAEYQGFVNVVAETAWLWNLLRELHSFLLTATLV
nr:ribonuclease H-like domain-containing protein [Tanacetum cinerariifolium]